MARTFCQVTMVFLLLVAGLLAIGQFFTPNLCTDLSSNRDKGINLVIGGLSGRLEFDEKLQADWKGFSAATSAALIHMKNQCNILDKCIRFSIGALPSIACPTEYEDFLHVSDNIVSRLLDAERIKSTLIAYEKEDGILQEAKRRSAGGTPGHLMEIAANVKKAKNNLSSILSRARERAESL